ncbi:hypothetical protein NHQ30_009259 [Ciborinia camelliae]|nr:hypothetical protein NHQ30_009259 [Ciborinia camelliae]
MTDASPKCALCEHAAPTRCSACQCTWYCSVDCQKRDWKSHKLVCKTFSDFAGIAQLPSSLRRPANKARLSILLPQDSKTPQLIWIMNDLQYHDRFTSTPLLDLRGEFPGLLGVGADSDISTKRLGHALWINHRDSHMVDGSKPNQCVYTLTSNSVGQEWRGALAIRSATHFDDATYSRLANQRAQFKLGKGEISDDKNFYLDISIEDFMFAIGFFKAYGRGSEDEKRLELGLPGKLNDFFEAENPSLYDTIRKQLGPDYRDKRVRAMKVCCRGEDHFLLRPKYLVTEIAKDDAIFRQQPTGLSKMIGLPILLRLSRALLVDGEKEWREENILKSNALSFDPFENDIARYLNLIVDASSHRWGLKEDDKSDTFLLVRQDLKRLTEHHVEVLGTFCFSCQVSMAAIRPQEEGLPMEQIRLKRESFMEVFICKKYFKEYFEEFKKRKVDGGDKTWENEISPFHV